MTGTEDPITAKITGSLERAGVDRVLASELGDRLIAAADAERGFSKGLAMRAIARRCRACAEFFASWDATTTLEQKHSDIVRWRETQEAARELGVR